jgi:RNA polymerase sigma-70 factor, ECF subfamily
VDEQAFNALYEATAKPLWKYVARVSGRPDVADDVLQESYLRLLRSGRPDMQLPDARPYLFRIATNLLHDRWRRGEDLQFQQSDDCPAQSVILRMPWMQPACCTV